MAKPKAKASTSTKTKDEDVDEHEHEAEPADLGVEEVIEASLLPPRRARIEEVLAGRTRRLVVVLETLEDGHNLSAILRSAEGFGVQEVHVVESGGPLEISPKVSQGCHKWLDIHHHADAMACVDHLHGRGYELWAAALDPRSVPLYQIDFSKPIALVFGNEHAGISPPLLCRCDGCYRIPMRGFVQSFNVSVAAAMSLFFATLPATVHGGGISGGLEARDAEMLRRRWRGLSVKQIARIRQALTDEEGQ